MSVATIKSTPIFIVSSGRSGTNLLVSMLNSSNEIHIPRESDFIARAYPFYQNHKLFDDSDYQKLVQIFMKSSRPRGWGMDESYLLSALKQFSPQTFAEVNLAIYRAYHHQEGIESCLWGIKAPALIASIDRILSVYPKAKIIHLVRDGRDVCLSYQNVHATSQVKFGPKSLVANALYWIDGLRRIELFKSNQIYEFRYEDLLQAPETELEKICNFIKINHNQLEYQNYYDSDNNKKLFSDHISQYVHSKVKGKLDIGNAKKYLAKMPRIKRFIFELIAIPYLQKYNYDAEFTFLNASWLTPFRELLYFAARQINNQRYKKRDIFFYQNK